MTTITWTAQFAFWRSNPSYLKLTDQPAIESNGQAFDAINQLIDRCNAFIEKEEHLEQGHSFPWHQHFHVRNRPYNYLKPEYIMETLSAIQSWFKQSKHTSARNELVSTIVAFCDSLAGTIARTRGYTRENKQMLNNYIGWVKLTPESEKNFRERLTSSALECANDLSPNSYSDHEHDIETVTAASLLFVAGLLALTFSVTSLQASLPPIGLIIFFAIILSTGAYKAHQSAKDINVKQYGPMRTELKNFLTQPHNSLQDRSGMQTLEKIKTKICLQESLTAPSQIVTLQNN